MFYSHTSGAEVATARRYFGPAVDTVRYADSETDDIFWIFESGAKTERDAECVEDTAEIFLHNVSGVDTDRNVESLTDDLTGIFAYNEIGVDKGRGNDSSGTDVDTSTMFL